MRYIEPQIMVILLTINARVCFFTVGAATRRVAETGTRLQAILSSSIGESQYYSSSLLFLATRTCRKFHAMRTGNSGTFRYAKHIVCVASGRPVVFVG